MSARTVRLDHLIGVYRVGSGDWPWTEEYDNLIDQPDTQRLLGRIREEGIREPILLGTDGRVWDGHHRIIIAMHLGIDSVPVEFAREVPDTGFRRPEVLGPQAEPTDAQVLAALNAMFPYAQTGDLADYSGDSVAYMRAALSAAFKAGGEGR